MINPDVAQNVGGISKKLFERSEFFLRRRNFVAKSGDLSTGLDFFVTFFIKKKSKKIQLSRIYCISC